MDLSFKSVIAMSAALSSTLLGSDTILIHGHIYTGSGAPKFAQAMALTKGKIDAVGSDQDIEKRREGKTKVIDLQGRTVIPGFVDSHTHMWFGGLALRGFNFATPETTITVDEPDLLVAKIKEYAASHPKEKVLFGRMQYATDPQSHATRQLLDRAVSDRPVIVHGVGEHSLWVNSKGLEMAGITDKPVADPTEERYVVRDPQGHPTGVLRDPAMQLVVRTLPKVSREESMAILRDASHYLNRFGITSVTNATGNLREIEIYGALRDKGELTVRTRTSFAEVSVNQHLTPQFLSELEKARTKYHDDWVSANLVKFFADGAGSTGTTAIFEHGFSGPHSPAWYEPAEYQKIIFELDKRGYQIMTHAIGNAAIHMVLDSYEQMEKVNGPRDRRLRIEHGASVIPDDVPRFGKLSVIDSGQPFGCCGRDNSPQKDRQWQTILKTGGKVALSSDWSVAWPPDPFLGIQRAVLRQVRVNNKTIENEFNMPGERLTVEQGIDAYTQAGAYARFADKETGTLEPGKYADLAVLSQDVFAVSPSDISKTKTLMTMVGGKVVFEQK